MLVHKSRSELMGGDVTELCDEQEWGCGSIRFCKIRRAIASIYYLVIIVSNFRKFAIHNIKILKKLCV